MANSSRIDAQSIVMSDILSDSDLDSEEEKDQRVREFMEDSYRRLS